LEAANCREVAICSGSKSLDPGICSGDR